MFPFYSGGSWGSESSCEVSEPALKHLLSNLQCLSWGFPGSTSGKEPTCQCSRHKRCGFNPWVGKIPWKRAWQPTLVFLPGESHRKGAWWATVHRVSGSDTTEQLSTQYLSVCITMETFLKRYQKDRKTWILSILTLICDFSSFLKRCAQSLFSLRHYSQQSRHGSNLNVYWQRNG